MVNNNIVVKRFDVVIVKIDDAIRSEQCGIRPAIIVQNDIGNCYSPNTIIMLCTSQKLNRPLPQHMILKKGHFGFDRDTMLLGETIRTISKKRILKKIGHIDNIQAQNEILDIFLCNFSGKRYNNNTISLVG